MSKTTEYMDEVKRRKGLTSNYQLSKMLEISEPAISECYAGKKHADLYIGTRLALALGVDPIHLLAEVRAEAEKNEKKRNFWSEALYLSTNYARWKSALGRWLSRCLHAWTFGALRPA